MNKKSTLPVYVEGQQVSLLKNIMRSPLRVMSGDGYGYQEPFVYIARGTLGTVKRRVFSDMYSIQFEGVRDPIVLYVTSVELVEGGK